jgi:hypothetical protein
MASEAGKGSRPRPYSVDQTTFASNWDAIFGKKDTEMTPSVKQMKKGTCGCGRSPTGDCIGWHGLTESAFQEKLREYELEQYKKDAKALWNDGCTSERSK